MARWMVFLSVLVAVVIISFAPLAMVLVWHVLTLLLSMGMFFLLVEEDGDLDSGIIALAILIMGLAGALLGKLSGMAWAWMLLLALPSIGMSVALLMRGNRA